MTPPCLDTGTELADTVGIMKTQIRTQNIVFALFVAGTALSGVRASAADLSGVSSLLLHSTMNDAQSIFQPNVAVATYGSMSEAIPGPAHVTFESGQVGSAARFDGNGFNYTWPVDGPARFRGENFDFDDPEQDGGRLDFWIKFNVDPHTTTDNTWVARSNWGERFINFEFSGSPANFMVDVYGEIAHNERTNYAKFRVGLRSATAYQNLVQGEWSQWSILWRRNGGRHKDELHIFINGSQDGCTGCSDYNGNLPPIDAITDFFFSPQLFNNYILFSIDEVYSFNSWDVSGVAGDFADLQIPEGVVLKYPMDNRYPVWGSPVPEANVTYEFTVNNDQSATCDCDLYVDGQFVQGITATSGAHMEIGPNGALGAGVHTYQIKCDSDRLLSPVNQFQALAETPVDESTLGALKARWR